MKEQIKELRVQIDGLMQLVLTLSEEDKVLPKLNLEYSTKSRSIVACHDSLELAKAWLGECLAELGDTNPYKGGYKTKDDIEPTVDTHNGDFTNVINGAIEFDGKDIYISENGVRRPFNHIEKVDWLRQEIEVVIVNIKNVSLEENGIIPLDLVNHLEENSPLPVLIPTTTCVKQSFI
jgi:hypothetical protein